MYCCIVSPGGGKNRIVESHWGFRMNANLFHVSPAVSVRTTSAHSVNDMQSKCFPAAHPAPPWSERDSPG
jgi:hypothetical protein